MRILVVEDDLDTSQFIGETLRDAGHDIEIAHDAERGMDLAKSGRFNLLVVDRMLPGKDGLSMVTAARAAKIEAPVLFLTALGAVRDRVAGLNGGGDDYIVKPFSPEELTARVNALARRLPQREDQPIISVGNLVMDRLRRTVKRGDTIIELQAREFEILETLILSDGAVLTRSMLLAQIWGFHFDPGTNIVETHISRIRGKIDRGDDPPLIHTVKGSGYVLRAD